MNSFNKLLEEQEEEVDEVEQSSLISPERAPYSPPDNGAGNPSTKLIAKRKASPKPSPKHVSSQ